ncbi:MAG: hypothetical protein Q9159_003296 [Coniocarpon cinnabarinum]
MSFIMRYEVRQRRKGRSNDKDNAFQYQYYASRFLAQSQAGLSLSQNEPQQQNQNPLDRRRDGAPRAPARGYLQRRPFGNPYQGVAASQTSRFPFTSRTNNAPAPLFYSANDEFREEDDVAEREREAADTYALQKSRRDFGTSQMTDSSEEDERGLIQGGKAGGGIKSSWTGDEGIERDMSESTHAPTKTRPSSSLASSVTGRGKDRLVDVELASTIHEADEEPSIINEEDPPSIQQFRNSVLPGNVPDDSRYTEREDAPFLAREQHSSSPDRESVLPTASPIPAAKPANFDTFFSSLFVIDMIAMLSTFFLFLLHTSSSNKRAAVGDTIYTMMRSSFFLLGIYTLVSIVVALVWIAALRTFVRPLVYLMLLAVPAITISFTIYPFVFSFRGTWGGHSAQDVAMRWLSWIPMAFTIVWIYTAYCGRKSLDRAINLLQFSTRILAACPTLVLVGFATLGTVVVWSWLWMLMFTRVFLNGHISVTGKTTFIVNAGTCWVGVFFVLSYLWTLGVIAGLQRATTAAATSQWYFYRNSAPASPQSVARASFAHATTKVFGTICFSTLLALLVRLPLLVLPARLSSYLTLFFYSFVPTSIATLTNPLTLTYAAIHSQPLTTSARGLTELTFVAPAAGTGPTAALTPHAFSKPYPNNRGIPNLFAYRLSKLLLHATRFIMAVAFGFGGWVSAARMIAIEGTSTRGSIASSLITVITVICSSSAARQVFARLFSPTSYPIRFTALVIAFVLNAKSLPLVWHLRFFKTMWHQLYFQRHELPKDALFRPIIHSHIYTPIPEIDWNGHKSNSTYFADFDMARTELVACLLKPGIKDVSRRQYPELPVGKDGEYRASIVTADADTNGHATSEVQSHARGKAGKAVFAIALGAVSCHFKREVKPYQRYEIWTRILSWDRKWIYILSHAVKQGAVLPDGYAFQPWKVDRTRSSTNSKPNTERSGEFKDAILATSLAKYVVKRNRQTVPPELVFKSSDLLPPGPDEPENGNSKKAAFGKNARENWTWQSVEEERQRGLRLAEHFAALDGPEGLHDEFPVAGGPESNARVEVLGSYRDLYF